MTHPPLYDWLEQHADALDERPHEDLLAHLGTAGVFRRGVPEHLGGLGGTVSDAVNVLAEVAGRSLTAAFVAWSQRTFIEYLLTGRQARALRERELPGLLAGRMAGATGLSNAMKFLSGFEVLQLQADREDALPGGHWRVTGRLPWITNLRPQGFRVAVVAHHRGCAHHPVLALPHDAPGLQRSEDLDLIALQGSSTAALDLSRAQVQADWVIDHDAGRYLPEVRPTFLGLQCALPLGLAQRSLGAARAALGPHNGVLRGELSTLETQLSALTSRLHLGLEGEHFRAAPQALFQLKIDLVNLAGEAARLELLALGGAAYLRQRAPGFARRWREQAFLPLITPSSVQLRHQLSQPGPPGTLSPAPESAPAAVAG